MLTDWTLEAAKEICRHFDFADRSDVARAQKIIDKHCPFKRDVLYEPVVMKAVATQPVKPK